MHNDSIGNIFARCEQNKRWWAREWDGRKRRGWIAYNEIAFERVLNSYVLYFFLTLSTSQQRKKKDRKYVILRPEPRTETRREKVNTNKIILNVILQYKTGNPIFISSFFSLLFQKYLKSYRNIHIESKRQMKNKRVLCFVLDIY